jgi:hypothetical protein
MKTIKVKLTGIRPRADVIGAEYTLDLDEKTIKEIIAQNPELTQPIEEKKTKFFTAKDRNNHGFILTRGGIDEGYNMGTPGEEEIEKRGVYATKEEAELADEQRKAIVRCWAWADENAYYRPSFEVKSDKFYVGSIRGTLTWYITTNAHVQFTLPYFKSQEDAEQFIKSNLKDLELLFLK